MDVLLEDRGLNLTMYQETLTSWVEEIEFLQQPGSSF